MRWSLVMLCASGLAAAETSGPVKAKAEHSKWQGTYTCAQGLTGVNLTIDAHCKDDTCALVAIFEFGEIKENPGVPHGSFRMVGESKGNEVTLRPDKWIEQPPGWIMVGVTATRNPKEHTLIGRMDHPSCGDISLKNVP
ncbi:MAG TPA: hypothetical protein VMJ10_10485 [Kofleriaceae bacterium]|nr:hypothetical protein [Kofleriaceae bacterium]